MWIYIATKTREFRDKGITKLSVEQDGDAFYIEYCKRGDREPSKIMSRDKATIKFGAEKPDVS